MTGYDAFLAKVLEGLGPVTDKEGGSGFFSHPSQMLDPDLFDGTHLKPAVRDWILNEYFSFMGKTLHEPKSWSTVWLAGSGISYQWAADRSNGDLDVLIGVNMDKFDEHNPDYVGLTEDEIADHVNTILKNRLWPKTSATKIGSKVYEVTFYVNPGAADIRDIKPYAAYDVSHDRWTVHPPLLDGDPGKDYPKDWWDHVNRERDMADALVKRYNNLSSNLSVQSLGSPQWSNSLSAMSLVVDQAKTLFDDIHLGRKNAFGQNGSGYGDFYNFRWQAHKRFGTMQALAALSQARHDARDAFERDQYGEPLDDAHTALVKAALWNRGGNGH